MTKTELRLYLEKQNLTQEGFANSIGVSGRTVRRWLRGTHPIPHWVKFFLKPVKED